MRDAGRKTAEIRAWLVLCMEGAECVLTMPGPKATLWTEENGIMKRIVIGADGTWQAEGAATPSYVRRMCEHISGHHHQVQQIGFCDAGIGTEGSWLGNKVSGAIGAGLNKNILDCYASLVQRYEPGDDIFLFGFSRGAYTVRSLAGLIRNCGILKRRFSHKAPDALSIYRRKAKTHAPDGTVARRFRASYAVADESPIHFLGVFDTVGSLGIPALWGGVSGLSVFGFHDVTLSHIVRHARHALAVDERRMQFPPTVWNTASARQKGIDAKQVWFAGVHSDIGGAFEETALGDCAGGWMVNEAEACGLGFKSSFKKTLQPDPLGKLNHVEWPKKCMRPRTIRKTARIHDSVRIRYESAACHDESEAIRLFLNKLDGDWNRAHLIHS